MGGNSEKTTAGRLGKAGKRAVLALASQYSYGIEQSGGDAALYSPSGPGHLASIGAITPAVLENLRSAGLVTGGKKFTLSDAGRACARRLDASRRGRDPFLAQHYVLEGLAHAPGRNIKESPTAWLFRRGHLDDREFAAAEQLRLDFEFAGLQPLRAMDPGKPLSGFQQCGFDSDNISDVRIAAGQRFHKALESAGPEMGDLLWRVVCCLEGIGEIEKLYAWPQRSGKVAIKLACARLADHYGIARTNRRRLPISGAHSGDYRPAIDAATDQGGAA